MNQTSFLYKVSFSYWFLLASHSLSASYCRFHLFSSFVIFLTSSFIIAYHCSIRNAGFGFLSFSPPSFVVPWFHHDTLNGNFFSPLRLSFLPVATPFTIVTIRFSSYFICCSLWLSFLYHFFCSFSLLINSHNREIKTSIFLHTDFIIPSTQTKLTSGQNIPTSTRRHRSWQHWHGSPRVQDSGYSDRYHWGNW